MNTMTVLYAMVTLLLCRLYSLWWIEYTYCYKNYNGS